MSKVLRIENLHKSYRSGQAHLHILAGLELEVAEGEMIAITGASGAGEEYFSASGGRNGKTRRRRDSLPG